MITSSVLSNRRRQPWLVLILVLALGGGAFAASTRSAATSPRDTSSPSYYLSLGDSLAEGWQPIGTNGSETLMGYSNRVVKDLAARDTLTLENFGCGGATSSSMLNDLYCNGGQAVGAVQYPGVSQTAAAVNFINLHSGDVKLITISIGANDYFGCMYEANPNSCLSGAMPSIVANLKTITAQLRSAVGPGVPIIGITDYVDDLWDWTTGAAGRALAKDWIREFKHVIVPALARGYAPSKSILVNMTAAADAYVPVTKLVSYKPYGKIPLAVERTCALTWVCSTKNKDEHPNNAGYALEAKEIAAAYVKATGG